MRIWVKLLVDDGKGVRGKNPLEIFNDVIDRTKRYDTYKVIRSRCDFQVAMTSGEDPFSEDPDTEQRKLIREIGKGR